jgi:hypothetical protein
MFLYTNDSGEARFTSSLNGPKAALVHLYNWDNPLGAAHSFPDAGTVNGKQVTINLYVQAIATDALPFRLINYSVFSAAM